MAVSYDLSLEGRAPTILQKCTRDGVPIYCVLIVICFPLLSLLQLGNGSSQALIWLTNILTASGLVNYFIMSVTYPYAAWAGVIGEGLIIVFYGDASFKPWDIASFFTNYTMALLAPVTFTFWKVVRRTRFIGPLETDLVWERQTVDSYERSTLSQPQGFWVEFKIQLHVPRLGNGGFETSRVSTH
ncbi:uncharacterized protein BJX67DRAFT_382944 [Aspergillus lucknowensis]|uniref:Amino acid permease/ SLC12A domain-containing protein n=1 Tax=Aspergillus lucknowensis TaxID=176173 RepID=A0ABR4LL15_9EURO